MEKLDEALAGTKARAVAARRHACPLCTAPALRCRLYARSADAKSSLELEPGNKTLQQKIASLEKKIVERDEKMKVRVLREHASAQHSWVFTRALHTRCHFHCRRRCWAS
ncbi:hypothetical protein EON66_06115 [archaeon]|nr:MAG: hypothetical protein EON66_06115 [archaeon]